MPPRQPDEEGARTHQNSRAKQGQFHEADRNKPGMPGMETPKTDRGSDGDSNGRTYNDQSLSKRLQKHLIQLSECLAASAGAFERDRGRLGRGGVTEPP